MKRIAQIPFCRPINASGFQDDSTFWVLVTAPVGTVQALFDLKSECVRGKYAYVHVYASALAIGYGADVTGGGSETVFNDSNTEIDPYVFNGTFRMFSAGVGVGVVASYGYIQLGQAFSLPDKEPSPSIGFDASILGTIVGRSAVLT